jgi:hypothetical protein
VRPEIQTSWKGFEANQRQKELAMYIENTLQKAHQREIEMLKRMLYIWWRGKAETTKMI